jgi:hypothetical protein
VHGTALSNALGRRVIEAVTQWLLRAAYGVLIEQRTLIGLVTDKDGELEACRRAARRETPAQSTEPRVRSATDSRVRRGLARGHAMLTQEQRLESSHA